MSRVAGKDFDWVRAQAQCADYDSLFDRLQEQLVSDTATACEVLGNRFECVRKVDTRIAVQAGTYGIRALDSVFFDKERDKIIVSQARRGERASELFSVSMVLNSKKRRCDFVLRRGDELLSQFSSSQLWRVSKQALSEIFVK